MNEYSINDILKIASENTKKEYRQVKDRFYFGLSKDKDDRPPTEIDKDGYLWDMGESA